MYHEGKPKPKQKKMCTNYWANNHLINFSVNMKRVVAFVKRLATLQVQTKCTYAASQKEIIAFSGNDDILSNIFYLFESKLFDS